MIIRRAKPEDSSMISTHILLAMEDIAYHFIGEKSREKAFQLMNSLVQEEANQYSYRNCWVAVLDNDIVGTAVVYDGALLNELRKPVETKIQTMFNRSFNPEDETQAGEYYIDCVGVSQNQQGKGIGSAIFQFLIEEYVHKRKETLGLLVDIDNPDAKRLYLKLGFEFIGEKNLVGKKMEHLQYKKANV